MGLTGENTGLRGAGGRLHTHGALLALGPSRSSAWEHAGSRHRAPTRCSAASPHQTVPPCRVLVAPSCPMGTLKFREAFVQVTQRVGPSSLHPSHEECSRCPSEDGQKAPPLPGALSPPRPLCLLTPEGHKRTNQDQAAGGQDPRLYAASLSDLSGHSPSGPQEDNQVP